MPITLTTPIDVPAHSYNLLAIQNLRVDWNNLNSPPTAVYSLQPYSTDANGVNTPSPTPPIQGRINDLFTVAGTRAAAGKPALAQALQSVLAAFQEISGEPQGK